MKTVLFFDNTKQNSRDIRRMLAVASCDCLIPADEAEFGKHLREKKFDLLVSALEYHDIVRDASSCRLASLDDTTAAAAADSADPFRETADEVFRAALARAIDSLPEREKIVMSLYYTDELNLKEIGAVLNVTESRVCQLHGQALARLRARLAEWSDAAQGGGDQ